jgi:diaminopimelate epimerase
MMISFAKYQALGNSFIVLDQIQPKGRLKKFERLALKICDPIYGVGSDGLMVVSRIGKQLKVDIYNADGSWAEKSGNGVRIAAMHLRNCGIIAKSSVEVITGSGSSLVTFHSGDKNRRIISASLGRPVFETSQIPVNGKNRYFINQSIKCAGRSYIASAVSTGNPHLILFCDNLDFDWETIGGALEVAPLFPRRINVGFVVVRSESEIEVRDWERGVGPTHSSGTGAAAAVVISVMRGFTTRKVKVKTQAGVIGVKWEDKTDEIIIEGPVEFICSGDFWRK